MALILLVARKKTMMCRRSPLIAELLQNGRSVDYSSGGKASSALKQGDVFSRA
jgi:hypothetical protein